jgi:putative flavoprotein involved in K+ transport
VSAVQRTNTLIVGGGQAGLALSRHLTRSGQEHVVLERGRIGERWRSERWHSLTLLTPNWLTSLPGAPPHADADGFLAREEFVTYLDRYARSFAAPVAEGVTVLSVERAGGRFQVRTDRRDWLAENVVVATGDAGVPRLPSVADAVPAGIEQLHASEYRSPGLLPPGGVLVVGAGPSGQQLALELRRSGREVVLAAGRHAQLPRRYRGRDIFCWLAELGELDRTVDELDEPAAARRTQNPSLSGRNGGEPLDLAVLQAAGVTLAGRLTGFSGSDARFADDLADSVAVAERRMSQMLARIDARIDATPGGAPAPEPVPGLVLPPPLTSLDLRRAGISTVLFATGYRRSYPWLHVPALDGDGELVQRYGATPVPGLYTLGLRFQRTRKSHFVGGVGEDAALLARWLAGEASVQIAGGSLVAASDGVSASWARRGGRQWCRPPARRGQAAGAPRIALAER